MNVTYRRTTAYWGFAVSLLMILFIFANLFGTEQSDYSSGEVEPLPEAVQPFVIIWIFLTNSLPMSAFAIFSLSLSQLVVSPQRPLLKQTINLFITSALAVRFVAIAFINYFAVQIDTGLSSDTIQTLITLTFSLPLQIDFLMMCCLAYAMRESRMLPRWVGHATLGMGLALFLSGASFVPVANFISLTIRPLWALLIALVLTLLPPPNSDLTQTTVLE